MVVVRLNSSADNPHHSDSNVISQILDDNTTLVTHTTRNGKYELEISGFRDEDIEAIKKLKEKIDQESYVQLK
jgi:hypothetical protein